METLRRIVRNYNGDMTKIRLLDMEYYIVRKDGAYAGCLPLEHQPHRPSSRLHRPRRSGYRVEKCAALLEGGSLEWPPF